MFRIMLGQMPNFAAEMDCRGPLKPIFWGDCEKKSQKFWQYLKAMEAATKHRAVAEEA
jgi:hypothetical protein